MSSRRYTWLFSIALVFNCVETKGGHIRAVALYGNAVPNTQLGTTFLGFYPPLIDNSGRVAFGATILGTDARRPLNAGIWLDTREGLRLVARGGDYAPGTPTGTYYTSFYLGSMQFSSEGDLTFLADIGGTSVSLSSLRGLWSKNDDVLKLIARSGDIAPGIPDINFGLIYADFQGDLSSKGDAAFRTYVVGIGVDFSNDDGIWVSSERNARLVAREGTRVPGFASGVFYDGIGLPVINTRQQVAFRVSLKGEGMTDLNRQFLLIEEAGAVASIARTGETAPGATNDLVFAGFGHPRTNDAGDVAFVASLRQELGSTRAGSGIWRASGTTLQAVALEGQHAPGVPMDVEFDPFQRPGSQDVAVSFSQQSNIAFRNTLKGGEVTNLNDEGVWTEGSGELNLIAREGQHAPGTPSDFVFRQGVSGLFDAFGEPVINAVGQCAFIATVNNGSENTTNDRGIWATDLEGQLQLITREGDLLEIAPGDFRTITRLAFAGGGNRTSKGFSDRGEVAFYAWYAPYGEGIFVSNLVAVPELSPASLSVFCLYVLLWSRPLRGVRFRSRRCI